MGKDDFGLMVALGRRSELHWLIMFTGTAETVNAGSYDKSIGAGMDGTILNADVCSFWRP